MTSSVWRRAALPVLGLAVAASLAGCSLLSPSAAPSTGAQTQAPAGPAVTATDLADTTWTGTDSAKIPTTFTFHANGSTAVTFGDKDYDDPSDTWAVDGSVLTITIYNIQGEGDATYTGPLASATAPANLAITFTLDANPRTLTITKSAK